MTRTKSASAKALLAKKKSSARGAGVKTGAEPKWRPALWRVVHTGHSLVRRLKAAHLGGAGGLTSLICLRTPLRRRVDYLLKSYLSHLRSNL